MNYRMSEHYEEEVLRLNRKVKELMTYAEKAAADNTNLMNENRNLKIHCNKYHEKYHSLRDDHLKKQLRIHELEDSRDKIHEASQRQKVNINKYLDMIRQQAERIKQLENSMKVHTIRNSMGGGGQVPMEDSPETIQLKAENERLRKECHELQQKLNESYNIIDELEFELETLDAVEADRDHLQQTLKDARFELDQWRSSSLATPPTAAAAAVTGELFNRLSVSDEATAAEEDHDQHGEEEEATGDGSAMSGATTKPAFAAFALATEDEEEDVPVIDEHAGDEELARRTVPAKSSAVSAKAEEAANEWKKRRQELHKRLEILHQKQHLNV